MSTPPAMLHPELLATDGGDTIVRDGQRLDHAEGASKPLRSRPEPQPRGRFRLVDRPTAVDLGTTRLWLRARAQRLRGALGVIEALAIAHDGMHVEGRQQLGIQHRRRGVHALAPRRKGAVGIAGHGSRGIYAASLSKLRPPGPKAMT